MKNKELEATIILKDQAIVKLQQVVEGFEGKVAKQASDLNNQISVSTLLSKTEQELKAKLQSIQSRSSSQEEALRK